MVDGLEGIAEHRAGIKEESHDAEDIAKIAELEEGFRSSYLRKYRLRRDGISAPMGFRR